MFNLALHMINDALSLLDIDASSIHEVTVTWRGGRLWSKWRVTIGNYTYSITLER